MWENSHLWTGVAGDGKVVGGEERGSHRQHGQPALGLQLGSWLALSTRHSQGILDFALGQNPTVTHTLERILGASQCAAESGLEGCIWAHALSVIPLGALL